MPSKALTNRIVSHLEPRINHLREFLCLEGYSDLSTIIVENCYVAGGAIRELARYSEKDEVNIKDYDIYFKTEESLKKFVIEFNRFHRETEGLYSFVYEKTSVNIRIGGALCANKPFSFITAYTGQPERIINQFDFVENMNFYDIATRKIHLERDGWNSGTLHYNKNATKPFSALVRAVKFVEERKYTIGKRELANIVEAIRDHEYIDRVEMMKEHTQS
jgi:hypothetical protein